MVKFTRDIDRIRVARRRQETTAPVTRICAWEKCRAPAPHPAPKSPERLREYHWFCAEHVREYNRSWNFFSGMNDAEIQQYIEGNLTGHRPTWSSRMGNPHINPLGRPPQAGTRRGGDPFNLFGDPESQREKPRPPVRQWPPLVREAFICLDLEETATLKEIKLRYKELVKRYHPDTNGGDRATEDQLQQVIQAYNRLKACGIK